MIASKETHDVLGGHLWCINDIGAVPHLGVYDGEAAISHRDRGKVIFTEAFLRFKGTLAMGAIVLEPGCPERKGLVERATGYLETSFLPGRDFAGPRDFNAQLGEWLATKANTRVHAGLRCRPSDRIAEDLDAMMALPPVAPDVDFHADTRLGRDHWVRMGTNDYSVHPRAIGRRVHVRADADHVVVTWGATASRSTPSCNWPTVDGARSRSDLAPASSRRALRRFFGSVTSLRPAGPANPPFSVSSPEPATATSGPTVSPSSPLVRSPPDEPPLAHRGRNAGQIRAGSGPAGRP
ncbi:MAG: hypothetical protein AB1673_16360 [Actinomycetota bacterium]